MSIIAKQSSVPVSATDGVQPHAMDAPAAHPKVARRPAQWKRAPIDSTPVPTEKTRSQQASNPRRPTVWQEDIGFSVLLLASIAVLNVLLISLTSTDEAAKNTPSLMIQQVTRAPVLPTPHAEDGTTVRMFANPEDPAPLEENRFGYTP